MRQILALLVLAGLALPAGAETLVAARTIRAATLIQPEDIAFGEETVAGAISDPSEAVGMEARAALYAGRPIRAADLVPAAVVERNQIIAIAFQRGTLTIRADGRALARGAPGDVIRVMNLASRTTIQGVVDADGGVHVLGSLPEQTGDH